MPSGTCLSATDSFKTPIYEAFMNSHFFYPMEYDKFLTVNPD